MAALSEWKIVLVDDEADIREVMAIALEDAGYEVHTASDGNAGIRLCETVAPQIVITDIRMPGTNGIQVLETVKKLHPDIEVIVFTAFGEMDLAVQALQLDASDFISKPVNDEALHMALARARARYRARKQLKDYTALLETEKAQTAEELRKTFALQKNLVESSIDGILACDGSGRVLIFNKSLAELLGYAKAEVLNRMLFRQFFPAGEAHRLQRALAGEKYGGRNRLLLYETNLKDRASRNIPVQVSAAVLVDDRYPGGLVCFFRDLRQLHRMERELADQARILHQDKMMSLGRLAASVVHEINNPLSGILNYVRLMIRILDRGPLAEQRREKFREYLELVEAETDRCAKVVSNLLTFSRKSPPAFETVSIAELIERCTLLSRHKLQLQHIGLETRLESNLPSVEGDFNQLQQCLINLIFNAVDAMVQGGTLTLAAGCGPSPAQAVISVADTGSGISEADLPHIFEPFFTTKKEGCGIGLGLSTVYGIVERHKGTVSVKSSLGKGTTFTIALPAKAGV